MINPSEEPSSIRYLCEIFQRIFNAYASNTKPKDAPSDLVLQIIPLNWVATKSSLAIPLLGPCTRLAKIVYDKCPLLIDTSLPLNSGAAFRIADQFPKKIDFKLTASSNFSPIGHTPVAHLGYCWNKQANWLSFAFVNDTGDAQWSASYHLGLLSDPWPYFAAVAREIWDITGEATDFSQDECKVYIAKTEVMEPMEIEGKSTNKSSAK